MRRFNEAFGPYGFQPQAIKPSYGLAEATLFVSTTPMGDRPKIVTVDRDALNTGTSSRCPTIRRRVAQASARQGGCRRVGRHRRRTCTGTPDGQIGEIWISGQNMGTGYWGKEDETRRNFPQHPQVADQPVARRGATDDATWVRTGDYGAYHDGELYITGRVKDLVIIDGRNHYPQDLEYSAQEATKALRTGFVAAFSVPANQLPDEVFDNAHSGLKRDPDDTSNSW